MSMLLWLATSIVLIYSGLLYLVHLPCLLHCVNLYLITTFTRLLSFPLTKWVMYLTLFLLILLTSYPMCLSLVTAPSLITSLLCSVSTNPPTNLLTSLIQFWTTPELTSVACVTFLVNMILVCSTSQVMLSSSGLL